MKNNKLYLFLFLTFLFIANNSIFANDYKKLHPVVYDNRVVYIDTLGKIVLDDDFETKYQFGTIGIEGLTSKEYPIYIFPEYAFFSEGKVTVRRTYGFWFIRLGSEFMVIDQHGNRVLEPSDRFVSQFSQNRASVAIPLKFFDYIYDEKYTFIDSNGNFVLKTECDSTNEDIYFYQKIGDCIKTFKYAGKFSDGWAIVLSRGKYNFIDTNGKYFSEKGFEDVKEFKGGFAPVKLDSLWGIIDKDGNLVIEPKYTDIWNFNDGLARFFDGKYYGFLDKNGKMVFDQKFIYANDFSEGFSSIRKPDGEFVFIDINGKIASQKSFDLAGNFVDGLARVQKNGKWGYIDKTFNFYVPNEYDFALDFKDGFGYVWEGDKLHIINKSKNIIWTYYFKQK